MQVGRSLRRWIRRAGVGYADATGCLGGVAVVVAILGLVAFLLETQAPSFQLWTGQAVTGLELGDTANFNFRGHEYTFQAGGRSQDAPPERVTIYFNPGDPEVAAVDEPSTRILDATFVLTPFIAAALFALAGWRRIRRMGRSAQSDTTGYGFAPGELPGPGGRHSPSS